MAQSQQLARDLWEATNDDDVSKVTALLERGADPNHELYWSEEWKEKGVWLGIPPLHTACLNGNIDIARLLVDKGGADVHRGAGRHNMTPLHWACHNGRKDLVQFLVEEVKCDINVTDNFRQTPLDIARRGRYSEVVLYLKSLQTKETGFPFYDDPIKGLKQAVFGLQRKPYNRSERLARDLWKATHDDDVSKVTALLEQGADPNHELYWSEEWKNRGLWGIPPLHTACLNGNIDIARLLVDKGGADVHRGDGPYNMTPLHRACVGGSMEVVKFLVEGRYCDVDVTDNDGDTPLDLATRCGKTEVVDYLKSLQHTATQPEHESSPPVQPSGEHLSPGEKTTSSVTPLEDRPVLTESIREKTSGSVTPLKDKKCDRATMFLGVLLLIAFFVTLYQLPVFVIIGSVLLMVFFVIVALILTFNKHIQRYRLSLLIILLGGLILIVTFIQLYSSYSRMTSVSPTNTPPLFHSHTHTVTSDGGQLSFDCGLSIRVPRDAIANGNVGEFKVQPIFDSKRDFILPDEITAASPTYLVEVNCTLLRPISVSVEHYIQLDEKDESAQMVFLKANSTTKRHVFREVSSSSYLFKSEENFGLLKTDTFSYIKVGTRAPNPKKRYTLMMYKPSSHSGGEWRLSLVYVSYLHTDYAKFLKMFEDNVIPRDFPELSTRGIDKFNEQPIYFISDELTFNVSGVTEMEVELSKNMIRKESVDLLEELGMTPDNFNNYPPRVLINFHSNISRCVLTVNGLEPPIQVPISFDKDVSVPSKESLPIVETVTGPSTWIESGTRPTMPQLLSFKLKSGQTINIPTQIGTDYKQFGVHLLKDDGGNIVAIIEQSCSHQVTCIVIKILGDWLDGKGAEPVTWATLVECLKLTHLNELANDIRGQYRNRRDEL